MLGRMRAAWAVFRGGPDSGPPAEARGLSYAQIFGGSEFDLDSRHVSTDQALRIAAVYACVRVIAETIATLPLHLYRRGEGDERARASRHYVSGWLNDSPNPSMTWTEVRESLAVQQVLRGNSFGYAEWVEGRVRSLWPLATDGVSLSVTESGKAVYTYVNPIPGAEAGRRMMRPEIAHFKGLTCDGWVGLNPIEVCRYSLASAREKENLAANTFANGARLSGILTVPVSSFRNEEVRTAMRDEWNRQIAHARTGTGTAILTDSVKYSPIAMTLDDAQFLESQKFSVVEVARIFRVPPHKIQDLERATFSNIEHQSAEFYRDTILPWLVRIEETLNQTLLTESERRNGYFVRHNAEGILRADFQTRMTGYAVAIGNGIMNRNEVRTKELLPPYEGGDTFLFPLNLAGASGDPSGEAPPEDTPPPAAPPAPEPPPAATPAARAALLPLAADLARCLAERRRKAWPRISGAADLEEATAKFLEDQDRALRCRLGPIRDAAAAMGEQPREADEVAADLAQHLSAALFGKDDLDADTIIRTLLP